MKRRDLETIIFLTVVSSVICIAGSMTYNFIASWSNKTPEPPPVIEVVVETEAAPDEVEVQRFPTVEKYFSHFNANPLSDRRGEPNHPRKVSNITKALTGAL